MLLNPAGQTIAECRASIPAFAALAFSLCFTGGRGLRGRGRSCFPPKKGMSRIAVANRPPTRKSRAASHQPRPADWAPITAVRAGKGPIPRTGAISEASAASGSAAQPPVSMPRTTPAAICTLCRMREVARVRVSPRGVERMISQADIA